LQTGIVWESPQAGLAFLVIALALLGLGVWRDRRVGVPWLKITLLAALRLVPVLVIAGLLARPVRVSSRDVDRERSVAVLVDRSESMSLEDAGGKSRYADATDFARAVLGPALRAANLGARPMLFAGSAEKADAAAILAAVPDGHVTDLGAAIQAGLSAGARPPLAVVALTDGASNQPQSNRSAVAALLGSKTPFIGVGFGTEKGVQLLNLREVDAPKFVPPKDHFRVSARLEATVSGSLPPFDLVLMRDGKLFEKRRLNGVSGSRYWSESFETSEEEEGTHSYQVRIEPPPVRGLVVSNAEASATVRVAKERELRVLYMQGALTWDYKFIGRALRKDPSVHVTGLSRTSENSVFRQNVEAPGELVNGFPDDIKELAVFRVIILANLNPTLLSVTQQDAIARFCSEYGGGVLLIGGRETFDSFWLGSRLEKILPVKFDEDTGVRGLDDPFRFQLSDEALRDSLFQIDDSGHPGQAWDKLPAFDDYGRIAEAKPGAVVWAVHSRDVGPNGKPRILMAAESFGAGTSVVLAVQNFWKWRLDKDCDPAQFDRFWQQLIRRLADSGANAVRIEVLDQELAPGRSIALSIERQADPKDQTNQAKSCRLLIHDGSGASIVDRTLSLKRGIPTKVEFTPAKADTFAIEVQDDAGVQLAARSLEIRSPNPELLKPARDMPALEQWGMFSGGSAWTAERARNDPAAFGKALLAQIEAAQAAQIHREPVGLNAWSFLLVLLPLCVSWLLRKRWALA